jgi:CheY-like chemotaxis protein
MPLCLIVEDHGDTREGYAEYLSLCGFDVLTAEDGTGFRTVIDRVIPDVVVMDIQLPHTDGWQLTAELRSTGRTRDIPIIIVSARVQAGDRERSFREGCDAFLGKPCDPHDLVDEINRLLKRDSLASGDRVTAASTHPDSP